MANKKDAVKRPPKDLPSEEGPKRAKAEPQAEAARVGSGRQAAQGLDLKENVKAKATRASSQDKIIVKSYRTASTEEEAVSLTAEGEVKAEAGAEAPLPLRRIADFSLASKSGIQEPIQGISADAELYLSGVIFPAGGPLSKEAGVELAATGRVLGWRVAVDRGASKATALVRTAAAEYELQARPAAGYKKALGAFFAQLSVLREVCAALDPAAPGGSLEASLDEVVLRLARSRVEHGYATARDAVLLNARFLLSRFADLDAATGPKGLKFLATEFARALEREAQGYRYVGPQQQSRDASGIVIREPGAEDKATAEPDADEEYARQLQAQFDTQAAARARGGAGGAKAAPYVQVSREEIADDYPAPAAYVKEEDELDELLMADEEDLSGLTDPEALPRRLLTDFSVYDAEGWLSSLELLPMWTGVDPSVELFASGIVVDDDGDFSGGQALVGSGEEAEVKEEDEDEAGGSSSAGAAGSSSAASAPSAPPTATGMRVCLSQIKDWVVEMGPDMLLISIRTDVAWYRLSRPAPRYAAWFAPVLKAARLAAQVLTWLSGESRASKLSFADVVKRIAAFSGAEGDAAAASLAVSRRPERVERFLLVHGAILLNQFAGWPVAAVRRSAFAAALKARMQDVRHSKLYRGALKAAPGSASRRAVNRNPMKDRAAGARSKPMTATATAMVRSVWQSYFNIGAGALDALAEAAERREGAALEAEAAVAALAEAATSAAVAKEVEEDENADEGEEDAQETALAERVDGRVVVAERAASGAEAKLVGKALSTEGACSYYGSAQLGDLKIALGDIVALESEDDDDEEMAGDEDTNTSAPPLVGIVQALWREETGKGSKKASTASLSIQVRVLVHGTATVLGDAASGSELFLTAEHATRPLARVQGRVQARRLQRDWDPARCAEQFAEDEALRAANLAAAAAGGAPTYFWRHEYVPEQGMFRDAPRDLRLGARLPEPVAPERGVRFDAATRGFYKDGVLYAPGAHVFLRPDLFDRVEGARREVALPEYLANSRFHKGSHVGLRAYGIGQIVSVCAKDGSAVVRRFYRPEDISEELAYAAPSFQAVYAARDETARVDVREDVRGRCEVVRRGRAGRLEVDRFECVGTYDRAAGKVLDEVADEVLAAAVEEENKEAVSDDSATKKQSADHATTQDDSVALRTMDIFAGCGGLSEGMHQAGAAVTKWAIEYEYPAAEAFRLNNPDAATFCNNCNVLLLAAMDKAGQRERCRASEEAAQECAALDEAQRAALPAPGEVDFICGGPPCQGYSGMNRFNKGNWSMVQNSMVMAFLSYADFYRPRYFLLENVRNFVSHNKSFTFRLTLRCLLDMGYQVRFGVLNAGNFGVAQSRKRTFIWAAAPGEILPDWPRLMHAFRTPQLTISLPNGVQYTAVPQTVGAPLRPVTVRDAIGDLPPIANGHDQEEMAYDGEPASAFQRAVRGEPGAPLFDHISKNMNELNLERCRCIPKGVPGADWRVLEEIVKKDPSREKFNGQPLVPWCLPNTADRHNGWRGLFGRLDPNGHFPTSTTDPQPMGKVGQVFHPDQDRIVSVRECARAQGFPDKHRFYGNVHNKHRQVGNAVPPPLAAALGRQLRKALEQKIERDAAAA